MDQVEVRAVPVARVFAANQVNAVIFRQSALISWGEYQYCSFFDAEGYVTVGRRRQASPAWTFARLPHRGRLRDAHNAISLGVAPDGRLHITYDHHGQPLRYRVGLAPGGLEFGEERAMTGLREERVTYPQFVGSPDGRFYFFYRDGASGNGDLCVNLYDAASDRWRPLQHSLISGEGKANPYWWRPGIGLDGSLHLAWCWRRSGDASTNRDVCYAVSRDGGETWARTDGSRYALPITADQAEIADPVEEGQNLINQCSSSVDHQGRPHLAHYRNDDNGIPQIYHVCFDGKAWQAHAVTQRTEPFSLSGGGTLRLPLSRPDVVVDGGGTAYVVYRDETAGGRVRLSWAPGPAYARWRHRDLTDFSVGMWEPSYDPIAWREQGRLDLWVHACDQGNHETTTGLAAQQAWVVSLF